MENKGECLLLDPRIQMVAATRRCAETFIGYIVAKLRRSNGVVIWNSLPCLFHSLDCLAWQGTQPPIGSGGC